MNKKNNGIIYLILFLFAFTYTRAVSYYWKANPVNYDYQNISNWDLNSLGSGVSPGVAPGPNDDVYFTAIPVTTTTILTTGTICYAKNIICTANYNILMTRPINIYGNIIATNGTLNFIYGSAQGSILLLGSSTHTIDMGSLSVSPGIFECDVSISAIGGTYHLNSDLICTKSIFFLNGNFVSHGKNISGTTLTVSLSLRTIDWEGSEINCSVQFNCPTSSGLTATTFSTSTTRLITPSISFNASAVCPIQFQSIKLNNTSAFSYIDFPSSSLISTDSLILNCLAFKLRGGGAGNSFLFNNMIMNNTSCAIENIAVSVTTGTINNIVIGTPICPSRLMFKSSSQLLTLSTPGFTVSNFDFYGIKAVGGVITDVGGKDMGFNSGITFTGAITNATFYWIGDSGNWDDPSHWSSSSGGTPNVAGCLPSSVDNVFFDINSFSMPNQLVTINLQGAYCNKIIWSDPSQNGSLSGESLFISGSADFTGCKNIQLSWMNFTGTNAETITMGGTRFGGVTNCNFAINCSGNYVLQDSLVLSGGALKHISGGFSSNSKAMIIPIFNNSASTGAPSLFPKYLDISNSEITVMAQNWIIDTDSLKSFNATGSHIIFPVANSAIEVTSTYLIPPSIRMNFWNVTFLGITDYGKIVTKNNTRFCSFNDIKFMGHGQITDNNTSDSIYFHDIYLTSGYQYLFYPTSGAIHTFSGGFVFPSLPCQDMITLQSSVETSQAKLYKANGVFNLDGAIARDINSTGVPLIVNNGMDYGNNTNVVITQNNYQKFYWVGGAGNWNDATHWSIGVSGASYPTNVNTNPNGCIPRPVDDVFFDTNSFTASSQTVTISGVANCLSMTWTSTLNPSLQGASADLLNIYGSIQLVDNMTMPFTGKVFFYSNTVSPPNTTSFKNVILNTGLNFVGKGRWDLQDSIIMSNTGSNGITFASGQLYTHGYTLRVGSFSAGTATTRTLDIAHSAIYNATGGFSVNHSNLNFSGDSTNVYLLSGSGISIGGLPSTSCNYHNFYFTSPNHYFLNASGLNIFCKKMYFNKAASGTFYGNFNVDTLILGQSQTYDILPGNKLFVRDTIIGSGTPCNFSTISSTTSGQKAFFQHARCSSLLYFYNIKDVDAVISSSCTVNNYNVYGNNINNNANWVFHNAVNIPGLGRDTSVSCNQLPYIQNTLGFGIASSYLWSTGSTNDTLFVADTDIYLGTTTYSVFVTYSNGCYLSDTRTLQVINSLKADTTLTRLTCFNSGNGQAIVHPSGGAGIYSIQFGSSNPFNQLNDSTINGLIAGNYYAIITQSNSKLCKDSINFTITQPNLLVASLSTNSVVCYLDETGALFSNTTGGNSGYIYNWTNGVDTYTTQNVSNVKAGSYTFTVTDSKGCLTNSLVTVNTVTSSVQAILSSSTIATCDEKNGSLTISVTGGTPIYNYLWNTGTSITPDLTNIPAGNYKVYISDAHSCKDTLELVLGCEINSLIPEIFSPNGDGKNDKYEIKSLVYYPNNTLSIFNRWGSLVYNKHNYINEWDGRANTGSNAGSLLPAGTYYVVLDFGDGETKPYYSFIQLEY